MTGIFQKHGVPIISSRSVRGHSQHEAILCPMPLPVLALPKPVHRLHERTIHGYVPDLESADCKTLRTVRGLIKDVD